MILRKISGRLRRARARGYGRSVRIVTDMAGLRILRLIFGFERWHVHSPTSRRPYRDGLAALVNELEPACVVEVGCGLGSVLSRVRSGERFGYDVDPGAVRAARFRHGRSIQFREGGFPEVTQPRIDVLVAVAWMHEFPPEQVHAWLAPLLPRVRHLVVDRVERSSPLTYDYYHDFAFLEGHAARVREERFGEEHRRFILYEVR